MLRLFAHAKYDFIAFRRVAYGVTAVILVLGLGFLVLRGLNYSIEFTGGTLVQIKATTTVNVAEVRSGLERQGIRGAEITTFGGSDELLIRARSNREGSNADDTQATAASVRSALDALVGADNYTVVRTEAVGPKVGGELRQKAFLAIFLSFFVVLAYLAYRFEWRFGLAAVGATAHDILATIAFISIMKLEVSLVVVAAVLSMVGYSLNDTIIIFDRVRENLHKSRHEDFVAVLNRSINETLPRSILTHGTTIGSLLALSIFGGDVIRPFALVMFFGVFTGTFSSIFIASPLLLWIEQRYPGADARGRGMRPAPKGARAAGPARRASQVTP